MQFLYVSVSRQMSKLAFMRSVAALETYKLVLFDSLMQFCVAIQMHFLVLIITFDILLRTTQFGLPLQEFVKFYKESNFFHHSTIE